MQRLKVTGRLKRTLSSTNPIEWMIEIVQTTQRNVKRWQSGDMAPRWTAAGLLEAKKQFREIMGYPNDRRRGQSSRTPSTPPAGAAHPRSSYAHHRVVTSKEPSSPKFYDERDNLRHLKESPNGPSGKLVPGHEYRSR